MGFVKQGSPEKAQAVCGYPTDPIEKITPVAEQNEPKETEKEEETDEETG